MNVMAWSGYKDATLSKKEFFIVNHQQQHPLNRTIAVFIDFENLALGFKDRIGRFEIKLVLKRLLEKGKIVAKKAYCDWSRFGSYTALLHESAVELIEIPKRSQTGKNSADIRLCVDAMDLAYSKDHIDTFVIVSGDSDFSPLVSKLKELGKHVIGFGMIDSTSALLRDNCDEFIYYEDLLPSATAQSTIPLPASLSDPRRNAFNLLFEALTALRREDKEVLGAAMIKNTICRMHPGFNESQFGYKSFSALLQDAAKENLLELSLHQKAGTWMVDRFGDEMRAAAVTKPTGSAPATATATATASAPATVSPPTNEQAMPAPATTASPEATTEGESQPASATTKPKRPRGGRGRRKPANKSTVTANASTSAATGSTIKKS
jgi:uncharacterized protein (TIGR00288 family)